MTHEKIIKKDNGDRIKIRINFHEYSGRANYDVSASFCPKGKRTFTDINKSDHFEYRRLSLMERRTWDMDVILTHITTDDIYRAKIECWGLLKP